MQDPVEQISPEVAREDIEIVEAAGTSVMEEVGGISVVDASTVGGSTASTAKIPNQTPSSSKKVPRKRKNPESSTNKSDMSKFLKMFMEERAESRQHRVQDAEKWKNFVEKVVPNMMVTVAKDVARDVAKEVYLTMSTHNPTPLAMIAPNSSQSQPLLLTGHTNESSNSGKVVQQGSVDPSVTAAISPGMPAVETPRSGSPVDEDMVEQMQEDSLAVNEESADPSVEIQPGCSQ